MREQAEAARQVDGERVEAAEAEQRVTDLAQRAEETPREAVADAAAPDPALHRR